MPQLAALWIKRLIKTNKEFLGTEIVILCERNFMQPTKVP